MLGLAGFQGRLLGQMQRFNRGRRPAVIALKRNGQLTLAYLDVGAAGRPALVQSRVDADDFSDRPFGRVAAGAFGEANSEGVAEVLLQRGVVDGMREG